MVVSVRLTGREATGPAIDLRGGVATPSPTALAAAARDPDDRRVAGPPPGPVHEHVGCVRPGMALSLRAAVAAAARSRGASAPQDDEIAAVRDERASLEPPDVDGELADARERLAEASGTEQALRERVARLSGRIEARRSTAADLDGLDEELRSAAADLADAETERLAAEQRLERARERARDARDDRERRLALTDRLENLRRDARAHLAAEWHDRFAAAAAAVPGEASPGTEATEFDGDLATAALAVVRLARIEAPVILAVGLFDDAERARELLDAPVVVVDPPASSQGRGS